MKDKLLYHIYIFLFGSLARLPLGVLYAFSSFVYFLMFHVLRYRKKVVLNNIKTVFPSWTTDEQEALVRKFYHYLSELIVEIIKVLHISEEEMNKRVEAYGTDIVEQYAHEGHPVFVLMGHFGNWEWAQQMYRHVDNPAVKCQIYRPSRSEAFDNVMLRLRSRFNSTCIKQMQAYRSILKMKQDGTPFLVTFLTDQHPNSAIMKYWTSFLGQDSAYIVGQEELGRKVDARYVYLDIERPSRGHYRMTVRPLEPAENEEYPYTISYLKMMEASILRQPEIWLWSHRRWFITHQEYNRWRETLRTSKPHTI
ncbi:MAG: lysophospholipid acyltransferase family protein [Bacteroidaceae bacterium]|nr:lysophospholipid acyltransferase family protein [Bacteroidaceae bacterium]